MAKNRPKYQERFKPEPGAADILASLKKIAEWIVASDCMEDHKRGVLSKVFWLVTEVHGKYSTQYRSRGTLKSADAKIQHEHVVTKKSLIDGALLPNANIAALFERAIACMVTEREHRALGKVDKSLNGWARYVAAGVIVYDMKPEKRQRMDFK